MGRQGKESPGLSSWPSSGPLMTGNSRVIEALPRKVARLSMSQSPHPVPQRRMAQSTAQIPLKPTVLDWEDMLRHSDDEDESPEPIPECLESSTQSPLPPSPSNQHSITPSPNRPSTTITSPTHLSEHRRRLLSRRLDPGILRFLRPVPSTGADSVRYRFDPLVPRPPHATKPTFGHLPGLYIGKKWQSRMGAAWDGTHLSIVAGISGKERVGVWSIAVSGGYEDDFDEGYRFVYTGSGGRNLKVNPSNSPYCRILPFCSVVCMICGLR
jgi:hypothetical protein